MECDKILGYVICEASSKLKRSAKVVIKKIWIRLLKKKDLLLKKRSSELIIKKNTNLSIEEKRSADEKKW